jgi:DNA-binding PadR family transcriptional regulator
LTVLEEKGYVKSAWDLNNERPRKVYELTSDGHSTLDFTQDSLELICRQIGTNIQFNSSSETEEPSPPHLQNKTNFAPTLAK